LHLTFVKHFAIANLDGRTFSQSIGALFAKCLWWRNLLHYCLAVFLVVCVFQ